MTFGAALLAGLIAAPMALLWLGHRLRDRSGTARAAFWGGVIGHAAGLIVMLVAAMAPPVLWEGAAAREVGVYWAPLLLAAAGAAAGAVRGRRRNSAAGTNDPAVRRVGGRTRSAATGKSGASGERAVQTRRTSSPRADGPTA